MPSERYSSLTEDQKQLLKLVEGFNKNKGNGGEENKPKKRTSFIPTPFSVEQIGKIFKRLTNVKLAVICYLAFRFGMRRGEIVSLNVEDIDWGLKRIVLRKGKTGLPHTFQLDKFDIKLLDKYVSLLKYEEGALFPSNINRCERITPESITNEFTKTLKKVGLLIDNNKKIAHRKKYIHSFHNLRTTFISILCNTLDDIYVVQQLARHSNIRTTLKYYAFCGSPKLKDAIRQAFFPKEYYRKNKNAISDEFEINEETNLTQSSNEIDPLKLLNLKLAQGTITPQDYQQRVSLLQSNNELIISKKRLLDEKECKNYIG
jgi:integrase